jgi:hypothetical protein
MNLCGVWAPDNKVGERSAKTRSGQNRRVQHPLKTEPRWIFYSYAIFSAEIKIWFV